MPRGVHSNYARGASHGRSTCPERNTKGERNGQAKLTEADVREMRAMARNGKSHEEIAALFDVTRRNVGLVVNRKSWAHVE